MTLAKVVLPVPGGPWKINEVKRSDSIARRNSLPGARMWACPATSSNERGRIRGVTLRDIRWARTPFNRGYTVSLIGGWDADHTIEDVTIENFIIDGVPVRHLDELEICARHCHNLRVI